MADKLMRFIMAVVVAAGFVASAAANAAVTDRHQRVGALDIYYGIVPAQIVGRHDPAHDESTMHSGVPGKGNAQHLIVAIFRVDGSRVSDAQVRATVAEIGMAGQTRDLEAMRIGDAMSFGNYFSLSGNGPYLITLEIRSPGDARPVEALFEYKGR